LEADPFPVSSFYLEEKETARNKYPWQPLRFDYKTFLGDKYNIGSLKWEEWFFAAGAQIADSQKTFYGFNSSRYWIEKMEEGNLRGIPEAFLAWLKLEHGER